jgi:hypothetical protein
MCVDLAPHGVAGIETLKLNGFNVLAIAEALFRADKVCPKGDSS